MFTVYHHVWWFYGIGFDVIGENEQRINDLSSRAFLRSWGFLALSRAQKTVYSLLWPMAPSPLATPRKYENFDKSVITIMDERYL